MAMAMVAGIAVCHLSNIHSLYLWISLLAVTAIMFGLSMLFGKSRRTLIFTITLIFTFFFIGALRCHLDDSRHDSRHWTHAATLSEKHSSYLTLKIKETPVPRERSWKAMTEVTSIDNRPTRGELRLYLRKDSTAATLRYGDCLLAHGYADRERGMLYITSDHYLVINRDSTSLRARCEALRMKLLRRMQEGPLEPRYSGIAAMLTLGWRGDLEPDIHAQFRDAGIMHLLCVSGLHVGLLAALIGGLLFFVGKDRRGRIIRGSIQLITIWTFVALSGLSPATVRAALMFSLFIVSRMMGRRTDALNLLAAAAIAMLAVDPMLLFNIGWQLSFSAVAGILLMRPALSLHRNILWQATIVSLAATLSTLPVTLTTFHQFYPYFLIANIVIIPIAAFILGFSLIYLALPCGLTAFLVKWPLWFCDWLTAGISRLPGAVITNIEPSPWLIALLSMAIIFIFITINIGLLRYKHTKDNELC